MSKRVLCAGIIVADFLVKPVEKIPEKGQLTLVDTAGLHLGGCATNTGMDLKKLGVDIALMGKVGEDAMGKFVMDTVSSAGIEITAIGTTSKTNTAGTAVLIYSDGERSFLHSIGASAYFTLDDIDFDYVGKFDIFHVAGALVLPGFDGEPMAEAAKKAKELGLVFCLDTVWNSTGNGLALLKDVFPYVDYFLPSIEEAKMITGKQNPEEIAEFLLQAGVKNVCLKMGAKGSFIMKS